MTQINLLPLVTLAVSASQDGDLLIPIAFGATPTPGTTPSPIDLTGISFTLVLKPSPASTSAVLSTVGTAFIGNSGTSGVLTVLVPQSRWGRVPARAYVGDIVATADGEIVVVGVLTVTQSVIGGCQITSVSSVARNAASAGSVGYIPGPGWNQYKGNYSATAKYVANDVVYYAFSSWIALGATSGNAPAVGSTFWNLVAPGVDPSIVANAVALSSQVAAAQATANAAAPNASPQLTGTPTAPTPAANDNSQRLATTAFVQALIAILTNTAPTALDTLAEIDAAINNDPNFATTVMTALGAKAPLASPVFTGTPTAPTAAADTNTQQLATTGFVLGQLGTANPSTAGTAAPGSSTRAARQDHVHPTDTTRAKAGANSDITSLTGLTTALAGPYGGTGQTTYVIGDILYASSTTALARLAGVATGAALISGGVGVAPSWGKIDLTAAVVNILPAANGGLGASSLTAALDSAFGSTRATILVRGQSGWQGVTPATSGTVLTFNGTDTVFTASTPGTGALRYDAAQTISASQGGQARFNIGKSAPIITTGSFTVDPNLGIDQVVYFNGAHTATLPANANVFAGWTTAEFHNLVATSLGTVAPPSGATLYNGAATVASVAVAYGQRVKFLFDGSAWRTVWIERTPLLLAAIYNGVASFDFAIPVGYQTLEFVFSNFNPSVSGSQLAARLSNNGGSSVVSGSNYTAANYGIVGSAGSGGSGSTQTALLLGYTQSTSYTTTRSSMTRVTMDTAYGQCLSLAGSVTTTPSDSMLIQKAAQLETGAIVPNLVRFISYSGGTFSVNVSCRGIPAQ